MNEQFSSFFDKSIHILEQFMQDIHSIKTDLINEKPAIYSGISETLSTSEKESSEDVFKPNIIQTDEHPDQEEYTTKSPQVISKIQNHKNNFDISEIKSPRRRAVHDNENSSNEQGNSTDQKFLEEDDKGKLKQTLYEADAYIEEHIKKTDHPTGPKFVAFIQKQFPDLKKRYILRLIKRHAA